MDTIAKPNTLQEIAIKRTPRKKDHIPLKIKKIERPKQYITEQ